MSAALAQPPALQLVLKSVACTLRVAQWWWLAWLLALYVALFAALLGPSQVWAQDNVDDKNPLHFNELAFDPQPAMHFGVEDDWLVLRTQVPLSLPEPLLRAMERGVAVQLRAQLSLEQPRWWWRDAVHARVSRSYRLSYQPLTRQWRTQTQAAGATDASATTAGLTLSHTHARLEAALAHIGRMAAWPIAPLAALPDAPLHAQLRVQINASQLPQVLQIHERGSGNWLQIAQLEARINPHEVALWTAAPADAAEGIEDGPSLP